MRTSGGDSRAFSLRCTNWTGIEMLQCTETLRGNLSSTWGESHDQMTRSGAKHEQSDATDTICDSQGRLDTRIQARLQKLPIYPY